MYVSTVGRNQPHHQNQMMKKLAQPGRPTLPQPRELGSPSPTEYPARPFRPGRSPRRRKEDYTTPKPPETGGSLNSIFAGQGPCFARSGADRPQRGLRALGARCSWTSSAPGSSAVRVPGDAMRRGAVCVVERTVPDCGHTDGSVESSHRFTDAAVRTHHRHGRPGSRRVRPLRRDGRRRHRGRAR